MFNFGSGSLPSLPFWRGRRVLVTGHSGFKGSWLSAWLHQLGATVVGASLPPDSEFNFFSDLYASLSLPFHELDIRDLETLRSVIARSEPEVVFHLAAQPLVRKSYRLPIDTLTTNIIGTANLLEVCRSIDSLRVVVVVTSDKVYENQEWIYPYRECDSLGGHDPYSASKAATEIVTQSYRLSFLAEKGIAVASARAGNVIGGGDWNEDRLLPDAVRAWSRGQTLWVRRPHATRPWQHVLEPLAAYLRLAEVLWQKPDQAGAYNFGPDSHDVATVRTVVEMARAAYGNGAVEYAAQAEGPHEANWLALDTAKARQVLGVWPRWCLSEAIAQTMAWYRGFYAGQSAIELCQADLSRYTVAHDKVV